MNDIERITPEEIKSSYLLGDNGHTRYLITMYAIQNIEEKLDKILKVLEKMGPINKEAPLD